MNTTNLPVFIMSFGVSGSGKSSYIRKNNVNKLVVSPDSIRKEILGNISDQSDSIRVWSRTIGRIEGALLLKKGAILDATNTEKDKMIELVSNLPKCYKIAWLFNVLPSLAFDRIIRDLWLNKDRAIVPKEVILRQHKQLEEIIPILPKYFNEVVKIKT